MNKLSIEQNKILQKMNLEREYTAYRLQCKLNTLDALVRKEFIQCINYGALGTMAFPRTTLRYIKIKNNE